ncbi:hypothetical protein PG995_007475 [Apiospora arundinis]
MDKLSSELLALVVDQLIRNTPPGRTRLSPYASISRAWQLEVERRCFKRLSIHRTDIAAFAEIFSVFPCRRQILRHLRIRCYPEESPAAQSNSDKDQLRFETDVLSVLNILKQWDDDDASSGELDYTNLSLWLEPFDPRSHPELDSYDFNIPLSTDNPQSPSLPLPRQFTLPANPLPISQRVHGLKIDRSYHLFLEDNYIHPIAICQIAAAFPRLGEFQFQYADSSLNHRDARLSQRDAVVRGLNSLCGKLPCMRRLFIGRKDEHASKSNNFTFYDLTDEEGVDPLCEAIRKLAQPTVEVLHLSGLNFSQDLLRNRRHAYNAGTDDTWPQLGWLHIHTGLIASNGEWYTTSSLDVGTTGENEENRHREKRAYLDTDIVEPLMREFTEAVIQHMPQIRTASIHLNGDILQGLPEYDNAYSVPRLMIQFETEALWPVDPKKLVRVHRSETFRQWTIPPSLQSEWENWAGPKGLMVDTDESLHESEVEDDEDSDDDIYSGADDDGGDEEDDEEE